MNRRQFFGTMIGGVATSAAVRTWPFRVFSFPSEIRLVPSILYYLMPGGILMTEDGKVWRNLFEQPQTLRFREGQVIGGSFSEIKWVTREDPLQFPKG